MLLRYVLSQVASGATYALQPLAVWFSRMTLKCLNACIAKTQFLCSLLSWTYGESLSLVRVVARSATAAAAAAAAAADAAAEGGAHHSIHNMPGLVAKSTYELAAFKTFLSGPLLDTP
jgi:hypothetical protein